MKLLVLLTKKPGGRYAGLPQKVFVLSFFPTPTYITKYCDILKIKFHKILLSKFYNLLKIYKYIINCDI